MRSNQCKEITQQKLQTKKQQQKQTKKKEYKKESGMYAEKDRGKCK